MEVVLDVAYGGETGDSAQAALRWKSHFAKLNNGAKTFYSTPPTILPPEAPSTPLVPIEIDDEQEETTVESDQPLILPDTSPTASLPTRESDASPSNETSQVQQLSEKARDPSPVAPFTFNDSVSKDSLLAPVPSEKTSTPGRLLTWSAQTVSESQPAPRKPDTTPSEETSRVRQPSEEARDPFATAPFNGSVGPIVSVPHYSSTGHGFDEQAGLSEGDKSTPSDDADDGLESEEDPTTVIDAPHWLSRGGISQEESVLHEPVTESLKATGGVSGLGPTGKGSARSSRKRSRSSGEHLTTKDRRPNSKADPELEQLIQLLAETAEIGTGTELDSPMPGNSPSKKQKRLRKDFEFPFYTYNPQTGRYENVLKQFSFPYRDPVSPKASPISNIL